MEQKEEKMILRMKGINSGFSIKKNGIVEIRLECDGSELVNVLGLLQLAGQDILVAAKVDGEKVKVGTFGFYGLHIDRDGDSKIVLQSDQESVNIDAVSTLYGEQEVVRFMFTSAA